MGRCYPHLSLDERREIAEWRYPPMHASRSPLIAELSSQPWEGQGQVKIISTPLTFQQVEPLSRG